MINDNISRVATPDDIQAVAKCARILIYEKVYRPDKHPNSLASNVIVAATTTKDTTSSPLRGAAAVGPKTLKPVVSQRKNGTEPL